MTGKAVRYCGPGSRQGMEDTCEGVPSSSQTKWTPEMQKPISGAAQLSLFISFAHELVLGKYHVTHEIVQCVEDSFWNPY